MSTDHDQAAAKLTLATKESPAHVHQWNDIAQESQGFTRQECECGATRRVQLAMLKKGDRDE